MRTRMNPDSAIAPRLVQETKKTVDE